MSEDSSKVVNANSISDNPMPDQRRRVAFSRQNISSQLNNLFDMYIKKNLLAVATLIAVSLAILIGILVRHVMDKWTERSLMYLAFPGEMFVRMLKCLILPLIISSLVSALGNLDSKLTGKIGKRAVIYYLSTTVVAIFLGIVLVLTISPGNENVTKEPKQQINRRIATTEDTIMDLIRNLFPPNLVEACFEQYSTYLTKRTDNDTDIYTYKINGANVKGTNILGLVVFSVILGIIIGRMKSDGTPLLQFFTSLSEASMRITSLVIKFTPIGVFFLIIPRIISVDDVSTLISSVGLFAFTVIFGLLIHALITLPSIYYFITRKNPYIFIGKMTEALMTAFGTSSSAATLPVTITCLEENNKVNRNVVRFCAPIGATINMDGTALYEAVAAIFIAQSRGLEMSFVKVIIISITATAASIGAAGIPQAGLMTMVIVLNAIGLPPEDIALVYIIDWLLDRFRTAVNVLGDAFGSAIVEHLSRTELEGDSGKETNGLVLRSSSPTTSSYTNEKSNGVKLNYNNSAFVADNSV